MKATVYTELGLQKAIGELRVLWRKHRYLRINASESKPRTLNQNSIAAVWYAQVSRELAEDTEGGVKCFCKLHYGVPILRADEEEFRALYDDVIKPLPYEKKLKAMGLMPVTSLMNTDQLSRYLTAMKEGYRGKVDLQFPDEQARFAA